MPEKFIRTRKIPLFEIHGTEDRVSEWGGDLQDLGGWGAYFSVPDAVQYWVERNELPLKSEGAHKVIAHKFVGKINTPQVWLYKVVGGVHSWFNEDMNTDVLATGFWAARISEITQDDTVLIIGAGPTGICTLLCVMLCNPKRIIVCEKSGEIGYLRISWMG